MEGDRLCLATSNGSEILDLKFLDGTNAAIGFKSSMMSKTEQRITFQALNPGDGVIFEVVHTGASSNDVHLVGTILGVKGRIGPRNQSPPHVPPFVRAAVSTFGRLKREKRVIAWMCAIALVGTVTLMAAQIALLDWQWMQWFVQWIVGGIFIVGWLWGVVKYGILEKVPPKKLRKKLEALDHPRAQDAASAPTQK
jgi:hypothetical protein